MFTTPSQLAERLFQHPEASASYALWLDSGSERAAGAHRLAALPDHVAKVCVSQLGYRELAGWLRTHFPPESGDGALYAVLLAYDAGRNLEELSLIHI